MQKKQLNRYYLIAESDYKTKLAGFKTMANFESLLKGLINTIVNLVSLSYKEWDKQSYISLVNLLLLKDDIAVKDAVDHIVSEGKDMGIPPLYLASKKHPNFIARDYCSFVIKNLDSYSRIKTLVANKDINTAINSLIEEFGNFRHDKMPPYRQTKT